MKKLMKSALDPICPRVKAPPDPYLSVPPPTAHCPSLEPRFGGHAGTVLDVEGADCTERYSTLLHCSGRTLLLRRAEARNGPTINHDYWWTVVREARTGADGFHKSAPTLTFAALNMSHNAAFLCAEDGQTVVAYGGRHKVWRGWQGRRDEPGIYRALGRIVTNANGAPATISWSAPALILDGSPESGCVERRRQIGTSCEFDGKLSVVSWRGRTLLYARANVADCGARHVQVTSSADGQSGWSRWQLLRFDSTMLGGKWGPTTNAYYFAVRAVGLRLVALFPLVAGGQGGVYLGESEDGLTWTGVQRLLSSEVRSEWRTADYPVDGHPPQLTAGTGAGATIASTSAVGHRRVALDMLIEHNVVLDHGLALRGCVRPATLCAYRVSLPSPPSPPSLPRRLHAGARVPTVGHVAGVGSREPVSTSGGGGACSGERRAALLLRGEAFRWGCSAAALEKQLAAVRSHLALAEALEQAGGCAQIFVVVDNRACPAAATSSLLAAFGRRLTAHSVLTAPPADQGAGVRAVVDLFRAHVGGSNAGSGKRAGDVSSYREIVLSRLDLRLLQPSAAPWRCAEGTVCVAAKCEAAAWALYRCVNDVLFRASGPAVGALLSSLGSSRGASKNRDGQCGCFDALCPHRGFVRRQHGTGHDCFNVLAEAVGASAISFAWPQVGERVSAANPHYELPQCDDVEHSAPYARRACRGEGKKMALPPPRGGGLAARRRLGKQRFRMADAVQAPPRQLTVGGAAAVGSSAGRWREGAEDGRWTGASRVASRGRRVPPPARVAVCLSGQLRVMVRQGLHHSLKAHVLDTLGADAFLHLDLLDTRQWGRTVDSHAVEYEEVVRTLSPVASRRVAYEPPQATPAACAHDLPDEARGRRVCLARDCGTFHCGCYLPGCTHCVTSQYLPQHLHASECLRLIAAHEAARGVPYELVVKIRPDLNVTRPMPSLEVLRRTLTPVDGPPALCYQGGGAVPGEAHPLAQLPLTMDDKFAAMPRAVADVYMNATSSFARCQLQQENAALCGGAKAMVTASLKGRSGEKLLAHKMRVGRRALERRASENVPSRAHGFASKQSSRDRPRDRQGKANVAIQTPYWATPQCVLKRHLLATLPGLHAVDCTRQLGQRPLLRLVRPY